MTRLSLTLRGTTMDPLLERASPAAAKILRLHRYGIEIFAYSNGGPTFTLEQDEREMLALRFTTECWKQVSASPTTPSRRRDSTSLTVSGLRA